MRRPDPAFDALAQVTGAMIEMERGKLNRALSAIKQEWGREGGILEDLPREIELRADAYHRMWPDLTLTPTALATHWKRVMTQQPRRQQQILDELKGEE